MTDKLSDKQRLRIQTRHRVSIENHGYQPQALYWSNREIQEVRFQNLINILDASYFDSDKACSILDVGCGFADLYHYLKKQCVSPDYMGIDISPDIVRGAIAQTPDVQIFEGELSDFKFSDGQFDYVLLSGALNEVVETEVEGTLELQGSYAKSVIKSMYRLCERGVAFNLLDRRNAWFDNRLDLQSFYPDEIIDFCQTFAGKVTLVEGYLDNDFTIYLTKRKSANL
ncbi:MAG: hypothetical protein ISEC1_P0221 [Thiomicrorhabdus sp.]|nr:MAG: hypothetical protein ISEC1_P0221 [Thiomicrorhabdus sp.]